jgi:hypothetical protein
VPGKPPLNISDKNGLKEKPISRKDAKKLRRKAVFSFFLASLREKTSQPDIIRYCQ